MPTHYELLNLVQGATASDVEAACEALYDTYRHLVNHPDQKVALEAQSKINELDEARALLTDPVRRAAYDADIAGAAGGLVDPSVAVNPSPVMPPSRQMPLAPPAPQQRPLATALWACPKCGVENPANTKFCLTCGAQLVRECPQCGKTASMVSTGFCGECGFRYGDTPDPTYRRDLVTTTKNLVERWPAAASSAATELSKGGSRSSAEFPRKQKSVGVAILLTILFGPLGMLYSTVGGAITMLIISVVLGAITLGVSLLITWPLCVIWGAVAASKE